MGNDLSEQKPTRDSYPGKTTTLRETEVNIYSARQIHTQVANEFYYVILIS